MATWEAGIRKFNRGLAGIRHVPDQVAQLVVDEIKEDVQRTFAAGQTPYGTPWRPRVREPADGHPLLDDTGALKDSLDVRAERNRIVVEYADSKAVFHDRGTRTLYVRKLVPYADRLPKRWVLAIRRQFQRKVSDLFR